MGRKLEFGLLLPSDPSLFSISLGGTSNSYHVALAGCQAFCDSNIFIISFNPQKVLMMWEISKPML